MSVNVIYTVETGEYSDHCIHAFCTTIEDAKALAAKVWAKHIVSHGLGTKEQQDANVGSSYSWPRVFANPANEAVDYNCEAKRIKWCERDPVKV